MANATQLLDVVAQIHEGLGEQDFLRHVMAVLEESQILACHSLHHAQCHLKDGRVEVRNREGPVFVKRESLGTMLQNPRTRSPLMALLIQDPSRSYVLTQAVGKRELRRLPNHLEIHREIGVEDLLAFAVCGKSVWHVLAFLRDKDYTEEERQVADLLRKQVHIAFQNHLKRLVAETEAPTAPFSHGLTAKEMDVLQWVCQGKRNKEIGAILGISEFTARNHVEKILKKLGAENRGSAAAMARGLFRP